MRLLHSSTFELHEFTYGHTKRPPPYAILSHTWIEGEEVSLQDMRANPLGSKAGYQKIHGCAHIAAANGFDYVWVDTCCIDKTSSSELSEALNSMYRWYQEAEVCYAYLSDVVPHAESGTLGSFNKSNWFNRGWTLQELIAPSTLIFFSNDWYELGTKLSLQGPISKRTGIQREALLNGDLGKFSVAQRMSWASRRETSRLEDTAYSLMGIFDVNMPMLYGEGERAFIRLQEEIMKVSDDQSIFAWKSHQQNDWGGGLLASSPTAFVDSGTIVRWRNTLSILHDPVSSITNRGLNLNIPLLADKRSSSRQIGVLDCRDRRFPDSFVGVCLRKVYGAHAAFERLDNHALFMPEVRKLQNSDMQSIYVRQGRLGRANMPSSYEKCLIDVDSFQSLGFELVNIYPDDLVQQNEALMFDVAWGYHTPFAGFEFRDNSGFNFILLTKKAEKNPSVNFVADFGEETLEQVTSSFDDNDIGVSRRTWENEPDRILRPHPSKGTLCVGVRKKITSGKKILVIDICCANQ